MNFDRFRANVLRTVLFYLSVVLLVVASWLVSPSHARMPSATYKAKAVLNVAPIQREQTDFLGAFLVRSEYRLFRWHFLLITAPRTMGLGILRSLPIHKSRHLMQHIV
jgi:hypothetical protein